MHRPSELIIFLKNHQLTPKKGLSQNFLIDGNILRKIIQTAGLRKNDLVLEIGPGPGVLTQALLEQGARVIAIEKDRKFAELLLRFQTADHRLEVIQEDILKLDLENVLKKRLNGQKAKIISNIPYHITSPILTGSVPLYDVIESLTLMVQKEFAERIKSDQKSQNRLSLFLQFYSDVSLCFDVSPTCFFPKPTVYSSVVHLTTKQASADIEPDAFFSFLQTAFQQKRKTLRSSLKNSYAKENLNRAMEALHLPMDLRPETLSLDRWIQLFLNLSSEKIKSCS